MFLAAVANGTALHCLLTPAHPISSIPGNRYWS